MERTAKKKDNFSRWSEKEKSRKPHGYWIFWWRKRWDSNPRYREVQLISSFMKYVTGPAHLVSSSVSFVLAKKPHNYWLFCPKSLKKPCFWGEFKYDRKPTQTRILGKNCGKNGKNYAQKATQPQYTGYPHRQY